MHPLLLLLHLLLPVRQPHLHMTRPQAVVLQRGGCRRKRLPALQVQVKLERCRRRCRARMLGVEHMRQLQPRV